MKNAKKVLDHIALESPTALADFNKNVAHLRNVAYDQSNSQCNNIVIYDYDLCLHYWSLIPFNIFLLLLKVWKQRQALKLQQKCVRG